MTTLDKVQKIVDWWELLPADFTGLNDLMQKRQLLSAHLYAVGTDLQKARIAWSETQAMYEAKKNQFRTKFSAKESTTKADYQARANTSNLYDLEKKAEAIYFGMKHIYDAIVQILEAMAQRIAILRREWEHKNYAGGTT